MQLPDTVTLREMKPGFPVLEVSHDLCTGSVALLGAHGNRGQGTISSFDRAHHRGFLTLCLGKSILNMKALSTTSWPVGIDATGSLHSNEGVSIR